MARFKVSYKAYCQPQNHPTFAVQISTSNALISDFRSENVELVTPLVHESIHRLQCSWQIQFLQALNSCPQIKTGLTATLRDLIELPRHVLFKCKKSVKSKNCCVVPHVSHLFAQCTVSCCWCLKSAFLCLFWVAHGSSCHLCFLAASICHFCFLISFEVYLRPELWTMTSQNGGRVKDLKHPGPSASRTQPRFRHQC